MLDGELNHLSVFVLSSAWKKPFGGGGRGYGGGGRGRLYILYLSLHCHHQNNSCIKMGSDESHFNVSLIVKDKVTRQCPFSRQRRAEVESSGGPMLTSLTPYR